MNLIPRMIWIAFVVSTAWPFPALAQTANLPKREGPACSCTACANAKAAPSALKPPALIQAKSTRALDWSDLLHADGSTKGKVRLNDADGSWMSAQVIGELQRFTKDGTFVLAPETSCNLIVGLSGRADLSGTVVGIENHGTNGQSRLTTRHLTWSDTENARLADGANTLLATSTAAASATYHLTSGFGFILELANDRSTGEAAVNVSVPVVTAPTAKPPPAELQHDATASFDWTDLLNTNGTSKGRVSLNNFDNAWISATATDGIKTIGPDWFHIEPGKNPAITVTLSAAADVVAYASGLGGLDSVTFPSPAFHWSELRNAKLKDGALHGHNTAKGEGRVEGRGVREFTITLGNQSGKHVLGIDLTAPRVTAPGTAFQGVTRIWGTDGHGQDGAGLIPEFGFCGYMSGYEAHHFPTNPVSVTIHGAKGDGVTDDTEAIRAAVAADKGEGIFFPAGTYVITDFIDIEKSKVYFIGESAETTKFYFPRPLEEVESRLGFHDGSTSAYSWEGGFIRFMGEENEPKLATLTTNAAKGARAFVVDDPTPFSVDQEIRLYTLDRTRDLPREINHHSWEQTSFTWADFKQVFRVTRVEGHTIHVDRPLRIVMKTTYAPHPPALHAHHPTVQGGGVKNIQFAFPNNPYGGHFSERGYNPLELLNAHDIVCENLIIQNADGGIFARSAMHCEFRNITFKSDRAKTTTGDPREIHAVGHHGILLGRESLADNVHFDVRYIHDLGTTSGSSGNVIQHCSGVSLSIDFHARGPFQTLVTDSHLGEAIYGRWINHGRHDTGNGSSSGHGTVFWNVDSDNPVQSFSGKFAPPRSAFFVGMHFGKGHAANNQHVEWKAPDTFVPTNLFQAQRQRRNKTVPAPR